MYRSRNDECLPDRRELESDKALKRIDFGADSCKSQMTREVRLYFLCRMEAKVGLTENSKGVAVAEIEPRLKTL